jgi:hypothetical protein
MKQKKRGYIMIFTLLVIAASMVVVSYVLHRGQLHTPFVNMVISREKAKLIALGGVQIAIAQLSKTPEKEEEKKQPTPTASSSSSSKTPAAGGPGSQGPDVDKFLLQRLLPIINRWQQFNLVEKYDGIDAELSLCLMCEDGKININRIYNFKKEMFRGNKETGWKAVMQELCKSIEKVTKLTDLFPAFEKTFKERRSKYNDATELITKKEFNYFKDFLFFEPPQTTEKEKKEKKQQQIYLTDIFTIWTNSGKIEPWLFSHSLIVLFGLTSAEQDDSKKRTEQVEGWLKNFKKKTNWEQDWKTTLQPMYGKELRTLPKHIDSMLSTTFDPRFFSVRVHAHVGEVTQQLYAVLERTKRSQGNEIVYDVIIRKLYWL